MISLSNNRIKGDRAGRAIYGAMANHKTISSDGGVSLMETNGGALILRDRTPRAMLNVPDIMNEKREEIMDMGLALSPEVISFLSRTDVQEALREHSKK